MKIKSIALALSFVAVSSVIANEDIIVNVGATTVEVEVSAHEVDVTTTTNENEVVVSVSTPEQKEKAIVETTTPEVIVEEATVSTETEQAAV